MYKNNKSVLVLIYAESTKRVLMMQRKDDPAFWQSVTGSIENNETPYQTALREVKEETGIDIIAQNLSLYDTKQCFEFEIFPQFRYKYAPDITHFSEHWFLLALKEEIFPLLTEHLAFKWLDKQSAMEITKSSNNARAIQQFIK